MVSVGVPVPGAALVIPYPHAEDACVATLVETGAAELVADELWRRRIEAGDPALVDP